MVLYRSQAFGVGEENIYFLVVLFFYGCWKKCMVSRLRLLGYSKRNSGNLVRTRGTSIICILLVW